MTSTPVPAPVSRGRGVGRAAGRRRPAKLADRWLDQRPMSRLEAVIEHVAGDTAPPRNALEVGGAEGAISQRLHLRFGTCVEVDLPGRGLPVGSRNRGGPAYLYADALALPFGDAAFDLVVCGDVLQHLAEPELALRELARVGSRHLVLSVPRRPGLDLVAGRYREAGDAAGRAKRWSASNFQRFVSSVGAVREVDTSFGRTVLWVTLDRTAA